MSDDESVWTEYRRIYSAAARMYWLQEGEVGHHPEWSQARKDSWLTLGGVLHEHVAPSVERSGPSDTTRHLISQRSSDGRPIPLDEAARMWQERLDASPTIRYPRLGPDPFSLGEDAHNTVRFAPGSCVLLPSTWLSSAAKAVGELSRRLAPGRPPVTVAPLAAHLSQTFHALANQLRGAFPDIAPLPHPATAPWITSDPTPHVGRTDAAALEELRQAAHEAAASTPTKQQAVEARDYSSSMSVIEAGHILRDIVAGSPEDPWREREAGIDPGSSQLVSADLTFEKWNGQLLATALEREPFPRVPIESEDAVPPTEDLQMKAMGRETALVVAEILDENAARLHPGRRTEMIGFDAYSFTRFTKNFTTHLLAL